MYHLFVALVDSSGIAHTSQESPYTDWRAYAFIAYLAATVSIGVYVGRGAKSRERTAAERLQRSALFNQLSEQQSGQDDRPADAGAPKT